MGCPAAVDPVDACHLSAWRHPVRDIGTCVTRPEDAELNDQPGDTGWGPPLDGSNLVETWMWLNSTVVDITNSFLG